MKKIKLLLAFLALALIIWSGVEKGVFYKTGRKIIRYNMLNSVSEYSKKSFYHSDIYYGKGSEDYIGLIGTNTDYFFSVYKKEFNMEDMEKVSIILYPDEYALSDAIGIDYSKKPPLGVYYAGIISLMSPETVFKGKEAYIKDDFLKNGPIAHEIAHYFLDTKTGGNYEAWFSEGVALYYEYKYTGFEWRKDLKGAAENIDITKINREFKEMDQALAYRCAFEIVLDITDRHGDSALGEIFDGLEKGESLKSILKAYL